ncbi:unnamed protein product [Hydatigera taeniaeformis]|uniref:SH2 domain-containing protein n=1 Tax=Hydatigena taeniaeformis TaxID=6205 RepID=A0A158RDU7_HYDTA|nr:unnamed protein product [Hydatigera taeniaeformis]
MQRSTRGDYCVANVEGGATRPTAISKVYSSPVSPVRQNSTAFSAALQQRLVNSPSGSFVTSVPSPTSKPDRSFPRSSIKQVTTLLPSTPPPPEGPLSLPSTVFASSFFHATSPKVRYDTQRPTDLETIWHSRSFPDHSSLDQSTRPQVGFNDSLTVFPNTASPTSPRQGDFRWTPSGYVMEAQSEPLKRRNSRPNDFPHVSSISTTAGNMYSQISAMTKLKPRGPRSPTKRTPFLRRGSNVDSSGTTFQMYVNGVEQSDLRSKSDAIKRRLLQDYELNRQKEPEFDEVVHTSTTSSYPVPPYFKELIMDYRGNSSVASRVVPGGGSGGGGFNDYSSGSISTVTSPTNARTSIRSTEQPSPNSVIEELQGRFQNSPRSREKRPILKNASVNADYITPMNQRRIATTSTATAALTSRPHHRSELVLPTTTTSSSEQPLRSINTASTVRLDPDPNGTLRATEGSSYRGGPSFRRLQTLYGTTISQKRFPSDNALDMTYLEGKPQACLLTWLLLTVLLNSGAEPKIVMRLNYVYLGACHLLQIGTQQPNSLLPQFYVSGRKAGTVKIQVRSRSEQTSPTSGPPSSPRQAFRVASVGNGGGSTFEDRVRSEQIILPQTAPVPPQVIRRNPKASSSVDGPQGEDEEALVLPSVREIIRQVEEMTLKNSSTHNSTTSLSRRQHHPHQQSANPGPTQHVSRSVVRPTNADQHGSAANRSQSASSILTNGGSLPRLINHDGVYHGSSSNFSDSYNDSLGKGVGWLTLAFHVARKGEQITNLPQDYQKNGCLASSLCIVFLLFQLLEAFLEQRREIQRLRKEMVDKDRLIATLEKDIHLYEPWR